MARITTPALVWLDTTAGGLARRRRWRLTAPLWFGIESDVGPHWLEVPGGFETDLASVPWPASLLIRPDSVNPAAPVIHDYLYVRCGKVPVWRWQDSQADAWTVEHPGFTRAEADMIFAQVLGLTGTPGWKVATLHGAVRLGGWAGWGR